MPGPLPKYHVRYHGWKHGQHACQEQPHVANARCASLQALKTLLHFIDTHTPETDDEWAVFDRQVRMRRSSRRDK